MSVSIEAEVKIRPGEYKTVTLTETDILAMATKKAEEDYACEPRAYVIGLKCIAN